MITAEDILCGRERVHPISDVMRQNLGALVIAINKLQRVFTPALQVSSGYRPPDVNKAAGGAPESPHLYCEAVDFFDHMGVLDAWCLVNQDLLADFGLWQEDPLHTPGWCHLDIRARSARALGRPQRVFSP